MAFGGHQADNSKSYPHMALSSITQTDRSDQQHLHRAAAGELLRGNVSSCLRLDI